MTDRRSLLDDDVTPTREGVNIFDDGFEVEDFDLIADGFRSSGHDRQGLSRHEHAGPSIQTVAAHYASGPVTPTGMSRNSTRKSRTRDNPFASPEDEAGAPLVRTPSGNFTTSHHRRSVSSASSAQYAGSRSSRLGAGGPSHPYGMYAQGTVARTPSVTTTSTAQPQRHSSSRNGPQHPYAMYTQGVGEDFDDDDVDAATPQNPVPVGFTGLGESYRRRRGPDGEEQDIIGVYGHTEQLPPYSRYPEDGPEKMPLLDVPAPPTILHSRAPVLGTDPGMPLMHTQLQPTQSMTDQSQLQRQPSSASRLSMLSRGEADSAQDSMPSNKSWRDKSWKEKKRTRICGIPFWWLLVVGGVIAFVFIVLIGSLVGYMAGVKHQNHHTVTVVSTSLYDASLIATPTTGSPPTGTFSLSFGTPQQTETSCLPEAGQQAAWNCDLGGLGGTTIVIGTLPGQNQSGAVLEYAPPNNESTLDYGSQISYMTTQFSPFLMVIDNDDPDYGSAYYFQQNYNKMVVLQEDALDTSNGKIKRDYTAMPDAWSDQKQVATPGDKPWFCFWNDTFLEGFIYPNQPAHTTPMPTFPTMIPTSYNSTIPSTSGPTTASAAYSSTTAAPTTAPTVTITTTLTMPSTTCTFSGAYSDYHPWLSQNYPEYTPPAGDGVPQKRYVNYVEYVAEETPLYPYLVKIEERRLHGATPAYCVQYLVLYNGLWNPMTDPDGQQIVVPLSETDPPYGAYQSAGIAGSRKRLKERQDVPGACHCQWMSGQQQ